MNARTPARTTAKTKRTARTPRRAVLLAALALAVLAPAAAFAQSDAGTPPDVSAATDATAAASDAGTAADAAPPSPPPATAPGGRSAAAALDPTRVPLGGRARYSLTVRHPPTDRVQLPPRGSNPFGGFTSLGAPIVGERNEGLVVATTYRFDLVALEPGDADIPPLAVSLVSSDGQAYALAAPAVPAEVVDPTANEPLADTKMRGAKGADGKVDPVRPYVVYVRDWTLAIILSVLGGILVVAAIAALITRWVLRRRRAALPSGPPPVPPYPAVRERLARLRIPGTYTRMGAKPFHVEEVEAVKEYLGRRHGIDALEMTSEELLESLDKRPAGGLSRIEMELFLGSCDIVKFARGEPTEPEALDALGTAERIVEQVEVAMTAVDMRRAAEEAARAAAAAARAAAEATPPAAPPAAPQTTPPSGPATPQAPPPATPTPTDAGPTTEER
jgi:hypothetical protein